MGILILIRYSYDYFQPNDQEENEVSLAYKDMTELTDNFDALTQIAEQDRVYNSLISFMQGSSIESVQLNNNKITYTLEDFGFKNPSRCSVFITFSENPEIFCKMTDRSKARGDLLFVRQNNKHWDCEYSGKKIYEPKECSTKNEQPIAKLQEPS